jgi:hypothetical protein
MDPRRRALTTRGNMAPQTTTSEHTNQTQMTADDIVAAVPSGRETTSNICRKWKNFNNNNNTEWSTMEFRRVRQSPSPHPQDPGDTSRAQGRQKRAHAEERWRTPDSDAPRDPRAAASPRVALAPEKEARKLPMELQTPTTRDVEADQTPEEESPPRKKRQRRPRRRRRQTFTQHHLDFCLVISTAPPTAFLPDQVYGDGIEPKPDGVF